jgi:predicted Fe-S protein YdhL (DUF1289 family)
MMKSPCIKVCVIDPDSGLCKGCLRTLDEIGRWGGMTDAQRDAVFSALDERKAKHPDWPDAANGPPLCRA